MKLLNCLLSLENDGQTCLMSGSHATELIVLLLSHTRVRLWNTWTFL